MATGKDFKVKEAWLSIGQIVALRFADDEDFLTLTERSDLYSLSPAQIKKSLKTWNADYLRV